jgi:membrane-anchored protein YejM (alkaline phosphatase superfamily)
MSGITSGFTRLAVLTVLCVVFIRWVTKRLRLPTPASYGIAVVFVLVVLTLYGRHLH